MHLASAQTGLRVFCAELVHIEVTRLFSEFTPGYFNRQAEPEVSHTDISDSLCNSWAISHPTQKR